RGGVPAGLLSPGDGSCGPVGGGSDEMLVDVGDTRLWVVERGNADGLPLIVLHGGPGLDHSEFGHFLDPLGDGARLLLVDQRAQGRSDRDAPPETWTIEQMARDVTSLAGAMGLGSYAVLGHSYGAFVALCHALDGHDGLVGSVISAGLPSARFFAQVDAKLAAFEPPHLPAQVHPACEHHPPAPTDQAP